MFLINHPLFILLAGVAPALSPHILENIGKTHMQFTTYVYFSSGEGGGGEGGSVTHPNNEFFNGKRNNLIHNLDAFFYNNSIHEININGDGLHIFTTNIFARAPKPQLVHFIAWLRPETTFEETPFWPAPTTGRDP